MVVCLRFEQAQDLQSIAEIFYRATPQIMTRGDRFIFLEISKCLKLYSPRTFIKRTLVTLRKINLKAKVTLAEDLPTALAFAIFGAKEKKQLPVESLRCYLDPLDEQAEIGRRMANMILLLKSLGIRSIEDYMRLSAKEISSRFSTMGLLSYDRLQGKQPIPWRPFSPTEIVQEKHEFDLESPVDNLEPIYFTLKGMIDRMSLRLKGKGMRARQFDVILRQEHALDETGRDYKVSILLQLPYVSNKVILQVVREMVDAQVAAKPLKARISEFFIRVTEEVPYRESQKDLFDQKKEENKENFFRLVSRMATKLGGQNVFFAKLRESYLPEKNWQRVPELKDVGPIQDPLAERPLRIFKRPMAVHFAQNLMFAEHIYEEIENIENREVVFAEWWETPMERIYYRLHTKSGRQLWLFKSAQGDFLHGEFD